MNKIDNIAAVYGAAVPGDWEIYTYPENIFVQSFGSWQLRGDIPLASVGAFVGGILAVNPSYNRDESGLYRRETGEPCLTAEMQRANAAFIAFIHNETPILIDAVKVLEKIRDCHDHDAGICSERRWELADDFLRKADVPFNEIQAAFFAAAPGEWGVNAFQSDKAAYAQGKWQLFADIPYQDGLLYQGGVIAEGASYGQHAGAVYLSATMQRANAEFIALIHNETPQLLEAVTVLTEIRDLGDPDVENRAERRWELANDFLNRFNEPGYRTEVSQPASPKMR